MDDKRFWSMIEDAWREVEGAAAARRKLAAGKLDEDAAMELSDQAVGEFVPNLQAALETLSKDDLLTFDRILERKLYDIDRSEIQEHTDGSDDGFLYARGFIVAAGKGYYDLVNNDPSKAMTDLECEDMCYLPLRVYEDKFGDMPPSDISRETGSNEDGWSDTD